MQLFAGEDLTMKRIDDVINNRGGSYILPFMWIRGESNEVVREEIEKIYDCGIREICVESRPHPDFAGDLWWGNIDAILDEARKRDMRVWILDDDKFPTGHANGGFAKKHPELKKTYLAYQNFDFIGPCRNQAMLYGPTMPEDSVLIGIYAIKRTSADTTDLDLDSVIDITSSTKDGFVFFDLPEGIYRVMVLFTTQTGGGKDEYMNLIDSKSVRVLIDEVYETHYKRYKEDFGKTFAGFFSDEPELGNTAGYDFQEKLGKKDVRLPWSDELCEMLKSSLGKNFEAKLCALWFEAGNKTANIRSIYMDSVTKLVYKCFSGQLGAWCEEHGVEYIGHVIEDDNAHMRMGCSVGHYFREMKGQHRAGIDVVHHQIAPGHTGKIHRWIGWDSDGEFFHYALAKMGSSAAYLDPKKQGRSLCEIFGNFGWAYGVASMKWLTDHMLVRGINHFVPHAFSMAFPDRDCPPHFYARGNNPQFKYFKILMRYMNRMCHLINGGTHITDAAVLYTAESEWSGGESMLFQKPCRTLMENQLDFDIVPDDLLNLDTVTISEGRFAVNESEYKALIIPGCDYIPKNTVDFAIKAASLGVKVFAVEKMPECYTDGKVLPTNFFDCAELVGLDKIAEKIKSLGETVVTCEKYYPDLRFFCYEHKDGKLYFFFNESVKDTVDMEVVINTNTSGYIESYNAVDNTKKLIRLDEGKLKLCLEPGQSAVYVDANADEASYVETKLVTREAIFCDWKVSAKKAGENNCFIEKYRFNKGEKLPNLNGIEYDTGFSGEYLYKGLFEVKGTGYKEVKIYFPAIGDCAEVFVNNKSAGVILSSPERIDVTELIHRGENKIQVKVATTLVWQVKDPVSSHVQLKPTGMTEHPILEYYDYVGEINENNKA